MSASSHSGELGNLIALESVTKSFGQKIVIKEISLRLRQGELISLLGANGSGKTTLLRLMMGLEEPDSGHVNISAPARSPGGTAFIFQNHGETIFPWLDALENVSFPLSRVLNKPRRLALEEARRVLESLPFPRDHYRKLPWELSGGQQQLVSFARAIVMRPTLLLLDEGLSALDEDKRPEVEATLSRYISRDQAGCIFVTHSIKQAVVLGSRILLLGRGSQAEGSRIVEEVNNKSGEGGARLVEEIQAHYRFLEKMEALARSGDGQRDVSTT